MGTGGSDTTSALRGACAAPAAGAHVRGTLNDAPQLRACPTVPLDQPSGNEHARPFAGDVVVAPTPTRAQDTLAARSSSALLNTSAYTSTHDTSAAATPTRSSIVRLGTDAATARPSTWLQSSKVSGVGVPLCGQSCSNVLVRHGLGACVRAARRCRRAYMGDAVDVASLARANASSLGSRNGTDSNPGCCRGSVTACRVPDAAAGRVDDRQCGRGCAAPCAPA